MKIVVTGGSGLVGNALHRNLSSEVSYITSADYDLTKMEDAKRMFETHTPTHVIHLAACVGGLYKNMTQKVKMLEDNLLINFNVVKCCHDYGVEKLVACLSTCIFPDKTTYPIDESMLHNGPPHASNDAYAYAKRMLQIHCKTYREMYGDNFVCVIPTNVYGIHDNYSLTDGHVIPALIHQCYLAKQNGTKFVVKGTGAPLRQFIYADDLARLILWSMNNYNEDLLILSVPECDEVSIGQVARMIAECFDYSEHIEFDTSYSDGQYSKTADNQRLMDRIHEFDFTDIGEGIKTTVAWFMANFEKARK
jgi:GDP-L-fucose synthase